MTFEAGVDDTVALLSEPVPTLNPIRRAPAPDGRKA
jgi:hypothetical protein